MRKRLVLCLGLGALAVGCGVIPGAGERGGTRSGERAERLVLSAADFAASPDAVELGPAQAPALVRAEPMRPEVAIGAGPVALSARGPGAGEGMGTEAAVGAGAGMGAGAGAGSDLPIVARAGEPDDAGDGSVAGALAAEPVSGEVLIEAKLGDVNGRPIYADRFLEPLSGRLVAEARRMGRSEWMRFAAALIARDMRLILEDELLRAEALKELTPEQKQGLFAFVQGLRDDLISRSYGSASLAAQSLAEDRGLSEEEYLREQEEQLLVRRALNEALFDRVQVSWRDIRQRYERERAQNRELPTARFRLLRVAGPEEAAEAARRLGEGEPFAALASSSINVSNASAGGLQVIEFRWPYEDASFFGLESLNDLARGLEPGEYAGPIEIGSTPAWLYLEEINDPARSLYDAQLDILDELRNERFVTERDRYMQRLQSRVNMESLIELQRRLLEIAAERYGPRA